MRSSRSRTRRRFSPTSPPAPATTEDARRGPDITTGRVRFIDHKGQQILLFDFSGLSDWAAAEPIIAEPKTLLQGQPEKSLLTLTDVSGATSTSEVAQGLYEFAKHNKPYVRAAAVVGAAGDEERVFLLVRNLAHRKELEAFESHAAAMDWLASRA
jgi:hypothetical protein